MTSQTLTRSADSLADIVDLAAYPLRDPQRRAEIVARCRGQLEQESCAVLPGFVPRHVAQRMALEGEDAVPKAYRRENRLTAYADSPVGSDAPPSHPARRVFPFDQHVIANDLLPADGLITRLYAQAELTALVADILDQGELHRTADPLLSCTVTAMADGDQHGWHFDSNDFVVSLLLRAPEAGGVFEFAPYVRGEAEQNFDAVGQVMEGLSPLTRAKTVSPGDLMVFCGRRALHRVSPIEGGETRLIALFCFDRRPGMQFSDSARARAVGRTAAYGDAA